MKRILTLLLLLTSSLLYSQATLTDLNLVFDILASNNVTSSTFEVEGAVFHSTTEYSGLDVQVGDLVYFQDGPTTYSLPIQSITTQNYSYIKVVLVDESSTVSYVPTGRAAVVSVSDPNLLPVPPDGIPQDLATGILNDLRLKIQIGVNNAEEITDYIGSVDTPPAYTASLHTGETWRNSVGQLFYSNGSTWLTDKEVLLTNTSLLNQPSSIYKLGIDTSGVNDVIYVSNNNIFKKLEVGGTLTGEVITVADTTQLDTVHRVQFYQYPLQSGGERILRWNDTDGTLDLGLKGGNVTLQLGQEQVSLVKHADNSGLDNGKVVYLVGSDGQNKTVRYAQANSEATSAVTFGLMTESSTGGNKAFTTTFGLVRNINTSNLTEGKVVWLSADTAGAMTAVRPTAPNHGVMIGFCVRKHATQGVIFVEIQNGYELNELHDVFVPSPTNGQVLTWNSTNARWEAITPANQLQTLSTNGSAGNISISSGNTITLNVNDADASATNELQTLSVAANTATLSNSGGSVTIAGAGINTVGTAGTTITVTGTEVDGSISNEGILGVGAGNATSSTILSNSSTSNPITLNAAGIISITETASSNGGSITLTGTEVDGSITNEIQDLSLSGQTLSLSSDPTTVTLPVIGITAGTGISTSSTSGNFTITNTGDLSNTNELQTLSTGTNTLTLSGGGGTVTVDTDPTDDVTGSGTSGQVAFWTGAQTQSGDNGLFWDNTLKDLGIGTNTPSSTLDVIGNAEFQNPTTSFDAATIGTELLTTGTGTNWTGTGYSTGYLHTVGSTDPLTSAFTPVAANYYVVVVTVSGRTTGSISFTFGNKSGTTISSNTTQTNYWLGGSTGKLIITPTTDFNGTVVASVKLITASTPQFTGRSSAGTLWYEERISNTNIIQGYQAAQYSTSLALRNIIQGTQAGRYTIGSNNIFQGYQAGFNNTTGYSNIFQGYQAGVNNTTGFNNIFQGSSAGYSNTTGIYNIFQGVSAGRSNTTGRQNVFQGFEAGENNTTGNFNVFTGNQAGIANTIGNENVYIGISAGAASIEGTRNTYVGGYSANSSARGNNNVTIGNSSARYIGTASVVNTRLDNSVIIGYDARTLDTAQTNQVVIGYLARGLGSNTTVLGNSSTTQTWLGGSLTLGTQIAPLARLHVAGSSALSADRAVLVTDNATTPLNLFEIRNNGDIYFNDYPNTLNTTGNPVNVLSTGTDGLLQSHPISEVISSAGGVTGSGAAGQVTFWNGTSTVSGDNGLFWDNTNKRLGIGTTSPGSFLSIYNTAVDPTILPTVFSQTIADNGNAQLRIITSSNLPTANTYPTLNFVRSAGTLASPTTPSLDMYIGGIVSNAYNGTANGGGTAGIFFIADQNISSSSAQQRISFALSQDLNINRVERLTIKPNGNIGLSTTSPSARLHVVGSGNTTGTWTAQFHNSGGANNALMIRDDGNVGIGTNAPGARLQIDGSGNTSTTTALTVRNSDGVNLLRVRNDLNTSINYLRFGSSFSTSPYAFPFTTNSGTPDPAGTNLSFYNYTGGSSATNGAFAYAGDAFLQTSGNQSFFRFIHGFNPTSGTATYTAFYFRIGINQTGGANGITRGVYVDPSLTSAADWRSIEWSNSAGYGLYGAGTAPNLLNGRLFIPTGSYDNPSLSFVGDANTGLYRPLEDNLELKTGTNNAIALENQATNLKTYSENFTTGGWNYQNITLTIPGNVTAPDGTSTANLAVPNTTLAQHRLYYILSISEPYTLSVYAKSAGYNFISFGQSGGIGGQSIIFDIVNGTISGSESGFSAQIENVGNGWFRCSLIKTSTAAATSFSRWIIVRNANSNTDYAGDGTSGVYLWGHQLETGLGASSYVKTDATIITRPQAVSILGPNVYGTLLTKTLGSQSFQDLSFTTQNATRMTITNGGSVGIGTTTPARLLHVQGEARISDLTTDTPTRIVGADADGDLGEITLGSGLSITSGTISVTNPISASEVFIESSTATTIDLDANTGVVKDVNGTNASFTLPTDLSRLNVYKNGIRLARTGTATTRDFSVNTGTNEITFTTALLSTDRIVIVKI